MQEIYVILYNIRSAYNVGSIFRTADAVGVAKICCVGITPTPIDRFGRARKDIAKVALGAEQSVPWEHYTDIGELGDILHKDGITIAAVEQTKNAIDYRKYAPTTPTAFMFGGETTGLPQDVCDTADVVLEIPMHGTKESLNVAVTAGIILFHVQ